MRKYSEYRFGDMLAAWWLDEKDHVGMTLIPAGMEDRVRANDHALEGLVQLHARGDQLPNGYGNGHTLAGVKDSNLSYTHVSLNENCPL